jgi:hypothetical protein
MSKNANPPAVFTEAEKKKRWFVTGGAVFIGSHAVDLLVSAGCSLVRLMTTRAIRSALVDSLRTERSPCQKDMLDLKALTEAIGDTISSGTSLQTATSRPGSLSGALTLITM